MPQPTSGDRPGGFQRRGCLAGRSCRSGPWPEPVPGSSRLCLNPSGTAAVWPTSRPTPARRHRCPRPAPRCRTVDRRPGRRPRCPAPAGRGPARWGQTRRIRLRRELPEPGRRAARRGPAARRAAQPSRAGCSTPVGYWCAGTWVPGRWARGRWAPGRWARGRWVPGCCRATATGRTRPSRRTARGSASSRSPAGCPARRRGRGSANPARTVRWTPPRTTLRPPARQEPRRCQPVRPRARPPPRRVEGPDGGRSSLLTPWT